MKLIYISGSRIPTEKAHGLQIMKMCEAFAQNGADLELLIPRRLNSITEGLFDYYGVKRNFKVKKIPIIDCMPLSRFLGPFAFYLTSASFLFSVFFYAIPRKKGLLYTRDKFFMALAGLLGWNVFYEAHDVPARILFRFIKKAKGIVVLTHHLKRMLMERGIGGEKIAVFPDGVDLEEFRIKESKEECRKKLGVPLDKKVIVYTGHLYPWKGVDTLLEAAENLPDHSFVYIIGGTEKDIENYKLQVVVKISRRETRYKLQNVKVIGHRPHKEIPFWLKAADVLVLPNSGKYDISRYWTSPMKLFEYMASGRPIVASNLPSIREVLNEENALLVEPDNSTALCEGIERIVTDEKLSKKIAQHAFLDVKNYAWQKRASGIFSFITGL